MSRYDDLVEMISTPTDDCLVWPHGRNDHGYGRVKVDGKDGRAHMIALDLHTPRPMGKVCSIKNEWVPGHKLHAAHGPCHNRLCFNPQHLSWKTRAENQADRKRDGTSNDNENHGNCKIPDADVARIRELYKGRGKGPTQYELADQFDCSARHIQNGSANFCTQ